MSDSWVQLIKQIAKEQMEASKPCDFLSGIVESVRPLCIKIDTKLILTKKFFIIPDYLTDREIEVSIEGKKKKVTIHNQFKVGEKVILLRKQRGQKYLILCKEKEERG